MIVWDYMVAAATWAADGDDSVEIGLLNAHGAEGWELVSAESLPRYGSEVHYRYVFKRPRPEVSQGSRLGHLADLAASPEVSEGAAGLLNLAARLEGSAPPADTAEGDCDRCGAPAGRLHACIGEKATPPEGVTLEELETSAAAFCQRRSDHWHGGGMSDRILEHARLRTPLIFRKGRTNNWCVLVGSVNLMSGAVGVRYDHPGQRKAETITIGDLVDLNPDAFDDLENPKGEGL